MDLNKVCNLLFHYTKFNNGLMVITLLNQYSDDLCDGININCTNNEGYTLLQVAWICQNIEVVKLLLNYPGVDVNKDVIGIGTIFVYACQCNNMEIISLLLERDGVNINARDNTGRTPMHYVCRHSNEKIFYKLLSKPNIDLSCVDNMGNTILMYACIYYSSINIVRELLDVCSINKVNNCGFNALMCSCMRNNYTVVDILLTKAKEWCIDIYKSDNRGISPIHVVSENGNIKILQLLLNYDIDVDIDRF